MRKLILSYLLLLSMTIAYTQDLEWAYNIGNTVAFQDDRGYGITRDGSGNIYVVGEYRNTCDFDPGAGTDNFTSNGLQDMFVTKYNSSGVYQWAIGIGGTGIDFAWKVVVDVSSNVYITGGFNGTVDFNPDAGTNNLTSNGGSDIFIAKYNSSGTYQWAYNIGGTGTDYGYGLAIDASSNIHISGYFHNTVDFNPGAGTNNLTSNGGSDIFIAKYNSSGTYQWAYKIGGTDTDLGSSITTDASSNVYITGGFSGTVDFNPGAGTNNLSSNGYADIYVAKYNSSGTYQWAIAMGSTASDYGRDIVVDAAFNVYVVGDFQGDTDFDPGAGTNNLIHSGSSDGFVAKYNSSGAHQWAFKIGGTSVDNCYGVALDASSNIYVTGWFFNTVDFNPSGVTNNLTSNGLRDIFVAKYTSNGDYLKAFNVGGTNQDYGRAIVADNSGQAYVTGYFSGTSVDFDPDSGTTTNLSTTAIGENDVFIAMFKESALPVELTYFKGEKKENDVFLLWQTEDSEHNLGFEIERSPDGKAWKTIGFVQGGDTLEAIHDYTFIDKRPLVGRTNYYRLKQIDFDGTFEYSELVVIRMEGDAQSFDIFPNPITDELMILNGQGQARIYNLFGQPVKQFTVDGLQYSVQTTDLKKGQYILCIQKENGLMRSKRFLKIDAK